MSARILSIDPAMPVSPAALNEEQAAAYLGVSPLTLNSQRARGGGPQYVKLGRRVVYRIIDLDAYLATNVVG